MSLTAEQRWAGGTALGVVALTRIGLRLVSLRRVNRLTPVLTGLSRAVWRLRFGRRAAPDDSATVRAVNGACRYLPGMTHCLPRALAADILLRGYGRGDGLRLRVGVAKAADGQLLAHAWLERDGVVLLDDQPGAVRYSAFRAGLDEGRWTAD